MPVSLLTLSLPSAGDASPFAAACHCAGDAAARGLDFNANHAADFASPHDFEDVLLESFAALLLDVLPSVTPSNVTPSNTVSLAGNVEQEALSTDALRQTLLLPDSATSAGKHWTVADNGAADFAGLFAQQKPSGIAATDVASIEPATVPELPQQAVTDESAAGEVDTQEYKLSQPASPVAETAAAKSAVTALPAKVAPHSVAPIDNEGQSGTAVEVVEKTAVAPLVASHDRETGLKVAADAVLEAASAETSKPVKPTTAAHNNGLAGENPGGQHSSSPGIGGAVAVTGAGDAKPAVAVDAVRPLEQIRHAVQAHRASAHSDGPARLEVELDPPELGRIWITVEQTDAGLTARLSIQNPQVRAAIEAQLDSLQQTLAEGSLSLAGFELADRGRDHAAPEADPLMPVGTRKPITSTTNAAADTARTPQGAVDVLV